MTRRNSHRGRGGHRGSPQGSQFRGRGRGQGRGRGRGNAPSKGQSEGGNLSHTDDFDFPVQMWPNNEPPSRGSGTPGSRGRGRGSNSRPEPGFVIPRRGFGGPRGQGRGRGDLSENSPYGVGRERRRRGFLKSKLRADEPLSKLLYEDRPLLKPITFVRSVHTATLFQQEEDILQPISDTVDIAGDEQSHVPTADKVTQVFNEALVEATEADIASANGQLEEIDFTDVGRLQAEVDATSALNVTEKTEDGEPGVGAGGSRLTARGFVTTAEEPAVAVEEMATGFYVDTSPTSLEAPQAEESIIVDRMEGVLGDTSQEEEEIIVYVAPHPRCGRAKPPSRGATTSPAVHPRTSSVISLTAHDQLPKPPTNNDVTEAPVIPIPPSFESISFSFNETPRKKQARRTFPVGGPRSLLKRSKRIRRKSLRGFSSFGAMMSEAHLQEEVRERDPRQSEQRRGDSDVNWGDSDSDAVGIAGDAIEDLSTGFGAMELDGEMSLEAMKSFVDSMSADGSRHITMDDIADLERMKREDADELDDKGNTHSSDGESGGSVNEEVELVVNAEERALIGEDIDEDEDEDDESSDDEDTPRTGFKARLAKIRANAKGKQKEEMYAHSSDEAMSVQMTWADKDEDFFAKIEEILEENSDVLSGRDRKAKKELFRAIQNGDFDGDEFEDMMEPAPRKKDKQVSPSLQAQWEKDREKKAENKRKRAQARLEAAADPMGIHKTGKKGRKAMLAAARLDNSVEVPNRITDLVSLEQQIRRFLADIGGKSTMALPPADKQTRKKIHELADAFNLKSQSKGKDAGRYTTLIKTSKSGIGINERKIHSILNKNSDSWNAPRGGKGKSKSMSLAKHREGEEVGKAAPKIGESNIGFKMLAAMGWAEGDSIGLSGGLEAPITAVMKKTKLGLGATL